MQQYLYHHTVKLLRILWQFVGQNGSLPLQCYSPAHLPNQGMSQTPPSLPPPRGVLMESVPHRGYHKGIPVGMNSTKGMKADWAKHPVCCTTRLHVILGLKCLSAGFEGCVGCVHRCPLVCRVLNLRLRMEAGTTATNDQPQGQQQNVGANPTASHRHVKKNEEVEDTHPWAKHHRHATMHWPSNAPVLHWLT